MTETNSLHKAETMTGDPEIRSSDPAVFLSLFVPLLIGLYLLLTSTMALIPGIWPYDAKRILQFGLLLTLFLTPAFNRRISSEFYALLLLVPAWIRNTLLGVFGWGVVSALVNAQSLLHALNSLSEVALITALVLGIFVVAACRRIAGRWFDRIAISMIALTGLTIGMQELIGVAAAHNAAVEFNFQVSLLHFSWPRFYNQVQSWAIPVLVAIPVLFPRHRLAFILCVLVLGLQWYIVLMTGARGSFVAVITACAFALIFLPAIRSRLFFWQIAGFTLGTLVFAAVMFSFESVEQDLATEQAPTPNQIVIGREAGREADEGDQSIGKTSFFKQSLGRSMTHTYGRQWMWSFAMRDARENPLLGIGPMNYACTSAAGMGHPHNFPLQIAAEWGIPPALALGAIFMYLFWRITYSIRRNGYGGPQDTVVAGLVFTGVLAAALHSCLSGVMVMPASQVTGLLLCGMLLGLYPSAPRASNAATVRWGVIPGLLLAASLLGLGAHELKTMQSRAEQLSPDQSLYPRIWQDAKVCSLYKPQNEGKN